MNELTRLIIKPILTGNDLKRKLMKRGGRRRRGATNRFIISAGDENKHILIHIPRANSMERCKVLALPVKAVYSPLGALELFELLLLWMV